MKFPIFGPSASVDIRPLPGAWVAELLGVVLGVQDHKNIKFPMATIVAVKGLTNCLSHQGSGLNKILNLGLCPDFWRFLTIGFPIL